MKTNGRSTSLRHRLHPLLLGLALANAVPALASGTSLTAPADVASAPDASYADPHDAIAIATPTHLAPGDFSWTPERTGRGQLVVVVSLPQQLAHVYRNGTRIGVSTISSGKPGHETPTGVFEILEKNEEHYSNLYDGAPMPYMQRLTWDGIALHAGRIPGYPASHGCVRLPQAFAQTLFAATERGMLVVVADHRSHGLAVTQPSERAPVDAYSGLEIGRVRGLAGIDHDAAGGESMASLE